MMDRKQEQLARDSRMALFLMAIGILVSGVHGVLSGNSFFWFSAFPVVGLFLFFHGYRIQWLLSALLALSSVIIVLALADGVLWLTGSDSLTQRVVRVEVEEEYKEQRQEVIQDQPTKCPRSYMKGGDHPKGWRWKGEGTSDDPVVVLIGDSVMHGGFARQLEEVAGRAGASLRILDTTTPGYSMRDNECVLDEVLKEVTPDLVFMGVCLNDFTEEVTLKLDLGEGVETYFWGARYNDHMERLGTIPLLVEEHMPWLRNNPELARRLEPKMPVGYADTAAFMSAIRRLGRVDINKHALLRMNAALKRANLPGVTVLYPLLYDPKLDPSRPLFKELRTALEEGSFAVTRLEELFGPVGSEHLVNEARTYDVVHLGQGAVLASIHEALRVAAGVIDGDWPRTIMKELRWEMKKRKKNQLLNALDNVGN